MPGGEHLTNECQFAYHDTCTSPEYCECMCHITTEEVDEFLRTL